MSDQIIFGEKRVHLEPRKKNNTDKNAVSTSRRHYDAMEFEPNEDISSQDKCLWST